MLVEDEIVDETCASNITAWVTVNFRQGSLLQQVDICSTSTHRQHAVLQSNAFLWMQYEKARARELVIDKRQRSEEL